MRNSRKRTGVVSATSLLRVCQYVASPIAIAGLLSMAPPAGAEEICHISGTTNDRVAEFDGVLGSNNRARLRGPSGRPVSANGRILVYFSDMIGTPATGADLGYIEWIDADPTCSPGLRAFPSDNSGLAGSVQTGEISADGQWLIYAVGVDDINPGTYTSTRVAEAPEYATTCGNEQGVLTVSGETEVHRDIQQAWVWHPAISGNGDYIVISTLTDPRDGVTATLLNLWRTARNSNGDYGDVWEQVNVSKGAGAGVCDRTSPDTTNCVQMHVGSVAPVISDDGRHVAFLGNVAGSPAHAYVVDMERDPVSVLTGLNGFTKADNPRHVSNDASVNLGDVEQAPQSLSMSADASMVAYARSAGFQQPVIVIHDLTIDDPNDGITETEAQWLYLTGFDQTNVTGIETAKFNHDLSADGRWLAFDLREDNTNLTVGGGGGTVIAETRVGGGARDFGLVAGPWVSSGDVHLSMSGDARSLAYASVADHITTPPHPSGIDSKGNPFNFVTVQASYDSLCFPDGTTADQEYFEGGNNVAVLTSLRDNLMLGTTETVDIAWASTIGSPTLTLVPVANGTDPLPSDVEAVKATPDVGLPSPEVDVTTTLNTTGTLDTVTFTNTDFFQVGVARFKITGSPGNRVKFELRDGTTVLHTTDGYAEIQ